MYAVILAGGFGTRLRDVIRGLPKPLAPVNGRPFLEYLIANLKKMGFNSFIFCLHYLAEKIQAYFGDGSGYEVKIEYSVEEKPLGTGGALGLLRHRLNETFCLVNADTYLDLDISAFLALHQQKKAVATLALAEVENIERYGQVKTDQDYRILKFIEKNNISCSSGYINAGLYLLEPVIFQYIPEKEFVSLEKEILPKMIESSEKIYGFKGSNNFFDIGTPDDYSRFVRWLSLYSNNEFTSE